MDRRSFVKVAGVAVASVATIGALSACTSKSESPDTPTQSGSGAAQSGSETSGMTPATIGYWGGTPCELPMFIAKEHNFFEEAGIDVNWLTISSDTSILLANSEIDCFMSTPGDVPGLYNGMELKWLDNIHVGCWSGVALDDSIKTSADLTGKTVGINMINGPSYVEVNALCDRLGGDSSQINWVQYQGSLLQEALTNGEVDAIAAPDAYSYPIKEGTGAHFYYISAQDFGEYYCCFVGANTNSLAAKPELGDKLVVGMAKAVEYIKEDPIRACDEAIAAGYIADAFAEIQRKLAVNYMFNHGNKSDFLASVKERFAEFCDSGLMPDAPEDASARSAYLDEWVTKVTEWHGDAKGAVETADKDGTRAALAIRGDAYAN
jgi:ABC-type nitrate/sulfonate/bicarbonate transport system substrate-binding protein